VADRAGHLLLAGIGLMSSLGVVAVSEAQMIGGAEDGAGAGTGVPAHSHSHTNQLFGDRSFDRAPSGPAESDQGLLVHQRRDYP